MITRRRLISTAGAGALAGSLLARPAVAEMSLGSATITTVSDGNLVLPGELLFGQMPADDLAPILARYGIAPDRVEPECNLALYRDGTNTVLFDIGSGPDFMPTAGTLMEALDAASVAVEDVTHVVFTHAHPDHIWGLLDDFDEVLFPDAAYLMGRSEWDYWWDPATVDTIGEARTVFAVGAKRRMEAIADRIEFFDDGQEILPGIAALACYGHTPGHMAFEVANGADSVLVVGDAIGNHHVAFERPGWASGSDQDAKTAAASRIRLLDMAASRQMPIIGYHLPGGGLGRVEAVGDGYRFLPEAI